MSNALAYFRLTGRFFQLNISKARSANCLAWLQSNSSTKRGEGRVVTIKLFYSCKLLNNKLFLSVQAMVNYGLIQYKSRTKYLHIRSHKLKVKKVLCNRLQVYQRSQRYNLFIATDSGLNKLLSWDPKKFQANLIFVSNDVRIIPLMWSTVEQLHLGMLSYYLQILDKPKKCGRDKHSSLFARSIRDKEKSFRTLT